jgi:hypothetical protein
MIGFALDFALLRDRGQNFSGEVPSVPKLVEFVGV